MVARLVVEEGDLKGLVLSLENGESWIIGRDPDACQLVIEDPLTSRTHLVARRTSEGISVENLSLTNPIQINEEEIGEQVRLLQQGDTLKIGNQIFRYYADLTAHVLDESSPSEISSNGEEQPLPIEIEDRPNPASSQSLFENEGEIDTIFDEEDNFSNLAEINFGIAETGRWLLKVIGGPNNGAEFYMQAGHSYILGTDPHTCDIVFHDTSVSRQHAKITVSLEDTLTIEDLKSRNGVLVSGSPLEIKQNLSPSVIVTLGTTSFVVYDREGEMQTIISPLLPSIVKVLQNEEEVAKPKEETTIPVSEEMVPSPTTPETTISQFGPYVLLAIISGLFLLTGMGIYFLFKSEPVVVNTQENAAELVQQAIAPFPAVRYSFNKNAGNLLLLGHVSNSADKNQLMYNLQGLKFIKHIDDNGIIIDEYVWREINSILSKDPSWRGITVHSPEAGQFILSGYLETRKQAEKLSDYISVNFPYLDLLKKQVIVEEDVIGQINVWLQTYNLRGVTVKMGNGGEITLSGNAPSDKAGEITHLISKIKGLPGVRIVNNYIKADAPEMGIINLSDRYEVTGQSKLGNRYTVVINGRILSQGDNLDSMTITSIKEKVIFLEKDGTKYRIDYK
ncbi:type III secretion system inner membrane ring subunit SctD [Candidatus Protochlamydia amoebophila]|nr:type III secretion system inner membrane ring subunit SctD [Candidatus Protochlamydia amoebophila]